MESSSPFFDAFISYGRADSKSFATKLYGRLEALGFNIWFDQEDIPLAVDFQEQINNGIEKTHNFIFVIAPHSVNSPYCLKEIELAIKLNKRIIPILHVEEITRETWQFRNPHGSNTDWQTYQDQGKHTSYVHIHPVVSKINWIFFRDEIDDFEVSLEGLIRAIKKHDNYIYKHTEYLNKALEWSRNQKRNQYLLKEEVKRQASAWLKYKFFGEQAPCFPTNLHSEFICESIKQAQGLMTQACLCYGRSQLVGHGEPNITEKIRNALLSNCIVISENCTNLQQDQDFDAATRRNIELADNFIYLVSPESLQSNYCQLQFQYAFECNKRLIFLLIEDTPSELYPTALDEIKIIDFSDVGNGENYRLNLDMLLNLLGKDEYYHESHKYLLVKALKWQEQRRIESLLLRGHRLEVFEDLLKVANQRKFQQFTHLQKEFLEASVQQVSQVEIEVFIAYDSTDLDFAWQLNETLEYQGKTTYFAHEHADFSGDVDQDIHQGIVDGANFLLVISPAAIASPYCRSYLDHAKSLSKRCLGVLYQPTDLENIQAFFTDDQWLDFSRITSDFYANFSQLIRLLDTDKAYVQSHTKWLQRSIEWEQKNKTRDLLLRGNELAIAQYWLKEADEQNKRPLPTDLQRGFIQNSITESLKNTRRQKFLFGAVSIGFVISTLLGIVASRKSYEAAVSELNAVTNASEALFSSGNILEAFVEALSDWTKEKKVNLNRGDRYIQQDIRRVISQSVYQLKESNRLIDHEAAVNTIDYSADGQLLVSGSADKSIILWDAKGNYLKTLGEIGPISKGHTASVNTVAFSPGDEFIVSGSDDNSIKIWERDAKGEYQFRRTIYGCVSDRLQCDGHSSSIYSVAFRYDGMFASAGADRTIKLWNLAGEYQGSVGDATSQHQGSIHKIIFSPDGELIISASADGSIKLWKKESVSNRFSLLNTFESCAKDAPADCPGHRDEVNGLAIAPDGKTIVSASDDQTVKIWQIDGTLLYTLTGHTDDVEAVAIDGSNREGKMIASVSRDKTIKLWSMDGDLLNTLSGHTSRVYDVAFKPHEAAIASASRDKTIKLWRLNNKIVTPFYGHSSRVYDVVFSPNNEMIASASRDKTANLWDLEGNLLHTFKGHTAEIEKVAFSPDSKLLATGSWDHTIKLWQTDGKLIADLIGHTDSIASLDFNPKEAIIASVAADQTLRLWDFEGNLIQTSPLTGGRAYDVEFSSDGKLIAISVGTSVQLWERVSAGKYRISKKIGSCQLLDSNCNSHTDDIEELSFSPDDSMIATGSRDSTVKVWDLDGNYLYTLKGHESEVEGVSFSPVGNQLVSASRDGTLVVWQHLPSATAAIASIARGNKTEFDLDSPPPIISSVLKGHSAEVYAAAFSSDGQKLISSSADKTIIFWKLDAALNLDTLITYGCNWIQDYLKTPEVEESRPDVHALCHQRNKQAPEEEF